MCCTDNKVLKMLYIPKLGVVIIIQRIKKKQQQQRKKRPSNLRKIKELLE